LTVKSLPVPEMETVCGLLAASSSIDKVLDEEPVATGLKLTVKLQLAFGANVAPQSVVKKNGPLGSDSPWMLRLTVPELVSVTTWGAAAVASKVGANERELLLSVT